MILSVYGVSFMVEITVFCDLCFIMYKWVCFCHWISFPVYFY